MGQQSRTTAELIVECLENEGVTHVSGVPGEENIRLLEALSKSSITYVLTRHEQGASFMAETYGRLTGRAGVCSATLGPGAINPLLGTADATTNSTPLIARIRELLASELSHGHADDRYPLHPARIVADTRAALDREDIVLVDTGALKMWMARLYPTYAPNTCLISNGLSTMGWTLPGAIGAKIARPKAKVLVATGDGSFLMNSQEIETALRLRLPVAILVWVDDAYGLISWKMDVEIGHMSPPGSATRASSPTRRASARRATAYRRPVNCCPRSRPRWPTTPSR